MANIATTTTITIGGIDWSTHCTSAELVLEAEEVDVTAFGDSWRDRDAGLKNATLNASFQTDYSLGTGSFDQFVFGRLGSAVAFAVRPTSASPGTSNPSYSGTALVTGYTPLSGGVGELSTFDISWPVKTLVARAVA